MYGRTPEHLVRDAGNSGFLAGFLENPKAVDAKTVLRLVVPTECKKLARPESEHQEHANNQSVAITEIEKNDGNLVRRKVYAVTFLPERGTTSFRRGVLDDRMQANSAGVASSPASYSILVAQPGE